MRKFVLQVAIDTVALLVSLAIFTLFSVPQPFPFGGTGIAVPIVTVEPSDYRILALVATGVLITVFYSILRPAIVILTGRLLLWSLGLFQVVVVAIVLWVVARITPLHITAADPALLWLLLISVGVRRPPDGPRRSLRHRRPARPGRGRRPDLEPARSPADAATKCPHREPAPPAGVRHALRLRC